MSICQLHYSVANLPAKVKVWPCLEVFGISLFVSSFSSCGFHFSPFHGCSHFLLFIPDPGTPIKGPVPPPDCVVEFRDSLFSKDTASERHSRDLNEYLKLNREAAIDRME